MYVRQEHFTRYFALRFLTPSFVTLLSLLISPAVRSTAAPIRSPAASTIATAGATAHTVQAFEKLDNLSDLWVDASQTACQTRDGKTLENAFCTISEAAELAIPGTTVHILGGTYQEHIVPSHSGDPEEGYIVFQAEPGEEVVIEGQGIDFNDWLGLFDLGDKSYIQVLGLNVQHSDWAGIFVFRSDHVIVRGNATYDTKSSGIYVRYSDHILVEGNHVRKAVNGGTQECITISNTSHFEVSYNVVHEGVGLYKGGEGIDVKGSSSFGMVHHNHVYDLPRDFDPHVHEDGEVGIYIDAYVGYLHDIDVYQNIVSTPVSIAVGAEQGGTVENVQLFNNVVHDSFSYGIIVTNWVQPNTGTKKQVHIVNNTVVRNGMGIFVQSPLVEGIIIRNNLISDNAKWQLRVIPDALSETVADHNLIHGYRGYADEIYGEAYVEGDPLFEDSSAADFHLRAGSPAIDRGNSDGAPAADFDGMPRPVDGDGDGLAQVDLGAYEAGSTSSLTFADVPLSHPYHDEIEVLYQAGYTAGCGADPLRYCPDQAMSRAESAVFVQRGAHGVDLQPAQPASQTFADLPLESWAAKWAEALYADGFTVGCGVDPLVYCPWRGHTRAEGAVFYLRMLHGADYIPPDPQGIFSDVAPGAWHAKWDEAAFGAGLIPACSQPGEPLRFCPDDPLSRGLAAYMMVRAKGLD